MAGPITIAVLADVANARKGISGVNDDLGGLGGKAKTAAKVVGAGLLAAGAAAVTFGVKAVSAASDAQQSLGATETVFGKFADTVIKTSKNAAQEYGLSANEYRENANLLGALFKNQGVAVDELAGKTESFVGVGADLAATFGGTTKEAVEALGSAFKGEFDPLEKYGISIKKSAINAELAATGQDKLTGAALKAAEQQATTKLIMDQASQAQGAFAKESNTLAGQQQRLGAQWENIKATIGTALLPVLTELAATFNEVVLPAISAAWEWLSTKLGPVFTSVKGYVDQLTASFGGTGGGGLGGAVAAVRGVFEKVVGVVGPIVSSLVALVRDNWDRIVKWTRDTFGQVRSVVGSQLELVRTVVGKVLSLVKAYWDRFGDDILSIVKTVFQTVGKVIQAALNIVQGIIRTVTAVIKGDWSGAWDGIKQILRGAWDAITAIVKGAGRVLWTVAKAAFGLLRDAAEWGVGKAIEIVRSIPGKVTSAMSGAATWLYETGKDIVRGLISGIGAIAGDVTSALVGLLPGPLQKFAGKLGIESPSKVFAGFGRNVGLGFVQGIDETSGLVDRSINRMVDLSGLDVSAPKLRTGPASSPADEANELLRQLVRAIGNLPREYRLNERTAVA